MTMFQIGDKVVVGRHFKELTKAEVLALGEGDKVVVFLEEPYRDHPKSDLMLVATNECLPLDETGLHDEAETKDKAKTKGAIVPAADKTQEKPAGSEREWAPGTKVLVGAKSSPIRGEILRKARVNYVVKALEDHFSVMAGSTVYALPDTIREAPKPRRRVHSTTDAHVA